MNYVIDIVFIIKFIILDVQKIWNFWLLYSRKMTRWKKHKFQTNIGISYEKESNNICDRRSIYE